MQKIASPQELQAEIRAVMAFIQGHGPEGKPDRQVVASKLRELADRVAADLPGAGELKKNVQAIQGAAKSLQHYAASIGQLAGTLSFGMATQDLRWVAYHGAVIAQLMGLTKAQEKLDQADDQLKKDMAAMQKHVREIDWAEW